MNIKSLNVFFFLNFYKAVLRSNSRLGEAAKAGSGYDLCSCPDEKPQSSFILL